MRAALPGLDQGEFPEGHELDGKWKVAKEMIGRRLSQAEESDCWRSSSEGYQLNYEPNSSSNIAIISSHSSTVIMINSIHSLLV
jgi:hypothetical protein